MQVFPAFFLSLKQKDMFKIIAKLNKMLLPSYSKKHIDLSKASNFQKAIIVWRYFVTTRALK